MVLRVNCCELNILRVFIFSDVIMQNGTLLIKNGGGVALARSIYMHWTRKSRIPASPGSHPIS